MTSELALRLCVIRQKFVESVLASPNRSAPAAATRGFDVLDLVVQEENFVCGKAAALFDFGEKFRRRLRPAQIRGVMNRIEVIFKSKLPPKKIRAFVLLNRGQMKLKPAAPCAGKLRPAN